MKRFALMLLSICLISGTAVAEDATAAVVTLRHTTEVDRTSIRLGDVFNNLPEGLDRDIATAPQPGKSVTYNVNVLNRLAQQYRLNWQPQSYGDRSVLTRAANTITQDMIQEAVMEKLTAAGVQGKIELSFDNRSLEIYLPTDRPADFVLNNFSYDATNKRFRSDLMATGDVGPVVLPVTGRVMIKREVPVLAKRLDAGTTISAADLDWMSIPEERLANDTLTDAAQLIGQEIRHATEGGQFLRSRDIMPPRLITRGSLVLMKVETPLMMITTQGRALQDGALGDVVRITNTHSNRVIEGTVEGPGIVRIQTAQKLASAG